MGKWCLQEVISECSRIILLTEKIIWGAFCVECSRIILSYGENYLGGILCWIFGDNTTLRRKLSFGYSVMYGFCHTVVASAYCFVTFRDDVGLLQDSTLSVDIGIVLDWILWPVLSLVRDTCFLKEDSLVRGVGFCHGFNSDFHLAWFIFDRLCVVLYFCGKITCVLFFHLYMFCREMIGHSL